MQLFHFGAFFRTPALLIRSLLLGLGVLGCVVPCVEDADDLAKLAHSTEKAPAAILLEFAVSDCEYCAWLEAEVLEPLLKSGEYDGRLQVGRVRFDREADVINFSGQTVPVRRFAQRYGVRFSPTVVLVDAKGEPLAAPLVGIANVEAYTVKLDAAIAEALARLRPTTVNTSGTP